MVIFFFFLENITHHKHLLKMTLCLLGMFDFWQQNFNYGFLNNVGLSSGGANPEGNVGDSSTSQKLHAFQGFLMNLGSC